MTIVINNNDVQNDNDYVIECCYCEYYHYYYYYELFLYVFFVDSRYPLRDETYSPYIHDNDDSRSVAFLPFL